MKQAQRIIETIDKHGFRITEQRKTLAFIFAKTRQPLAPKDVYKRMNAVYSGLSTDTVYRNIRLLVEVGAIEAVFFPEGVRYQVACNETHHHHHLICLICERTLPLDACPFDLGIGIPERFTIVRHTFQVQGYCESCSADRLQ
ncbi:transcriptional repressor [Paenibacillus sp. TRM 82003]|nr:transcriptional repressor [Paenibacillus sp. TRM 82003]